MQVVRIAELDDPRLVDYANIRDASLLADRRVFIAESRLVVRTLIESSPYRVRSLLLTATALEGLENLVELLPEETPAFLVTRSVIDRVVGFHIHQGCLAAGERGAEKSASDLVAAYPHARRWLVLESVSNPDNVGAIARHALALGGGPMLLDARCADPLYRKAIRTSVGASLRLPFGRIDSVAGAVETLKRAGASVVALTPDLDAEPIGDLVRRGAPSRLALLLGNEGDGLSDGARACADLEVRIPMAGNVDSINVGAATAIALFALA